MSRANDAGNNASQDSSSNLLAFGSPRFNRQNNNSKNSGSNYTKERQTNPSDMFLEDMRSTSSNFMEGSVDRGYTSNRLSRMRSDRRQVTNGKIRFNSVSSESDAGMRQSMGDLDGTMREIKEVRRVEEPANTRCCFGLFGGGD